MTLERAKDIWTLCLLQTIAIANFIIFGLVHELGWKDASDYSSYAKNLLLGNGYSIDGVQFSLYREPGVPLYLIPFYKALGIETPVAIFTSMFFEAILLGFLGFIVYRLMKEYGRTFALIAASTITALPILGDHTGDVGTETLFTFFIVAIFAVCVRIMQSPNLSWHWYALLGIMAGYQSLVRMQFILFLPFAVFCFLIYLRLRSISFSWQIIRNICVALFIFASLPLSFATYIYANTGLFAISQGRDSEMLYYRAARAELSYSEITQYLRDWLWRSISGGINTQHLTDNEFKKLGYEYELQATTTEAKARIRAENIQTILSRPGHYLYGNVVEIIKLAYIEHDYSDKFNRYFRPSQYVLMYGFFLFGVYQLLKRKGHWDIKSIALLAILFIFYNTLLLSFLNTVPRFNTPYLPLFVLIGFLGVLLYRRGDESAKNLKLFK